MNPDSAPSFPLPDITARLDAMDWAQVTHELDDEGCTTLPALLLPAECEHRRATYPNDETFRSHPVDGMRWESSSTTRSDSFSEFTSKKRSAVENSRC